MTNLAQRVGRQVEDYLRKHPQEALSLEKLKEQISMPLALDDRSNMVGHLTASVFLLSADRARIFVLKNRALDLWVLPGGHVDPGETPLASAGREVIEETGFENFTFLSDFPIDIDTHPIPARPERNEGGHWHHDFRFVAVLAEDAAPTLQTSEISDGKWINLDDLTMDSVAPSLHRAIIKLRLKGADL